MAITFKLEFPTVSDKVNTTVGILQLEYGGKKETYTTQKVSEIEAKTFTADVTSASDIKTVSSKLVCPIITTANYEITDVKGHCGRSYDGSMVLPVGSSFTFGKYFSKAKKWNFLLNRSFYKLTPTQNEFSLKGIFKDMANCANYRTDVFYEYRGVNIVNTDEIFMNNTALTGLDNHNGIMNHFPNTRSMVSTFRATGITNIPPNFFLQNTKVTDYSYVAAYCPNLTSVASYTINFRV